MNVNRVAVIGAGPCGVAAIRCLLAEKKFSYIHAFEQRDTVGGVWTYNTLSVDDKNFSVPRTKPSTKSDIPVDVPGKDAPQFLSPVYDFLETNIPNTLMGYADKPFPPGTPLFPSHTVVKKYVEDCAQDLKEYISLSTQVVDVKKVRNEDESYWEVETVDLRTKQTHKSQFDAILVASGHYNDPYIPDIPGLVEFEKAYPNSISHSKFYRNPAHYRDQKVIVVGNSASGIDVSAQVKDVSQLPVLVSERSTPNTPSEDRSQWSRLVPEIAEFIPSGRQVRFSNGETISDVDVIIFCTGYHYSFPFLRSLSPPIVTDGSHAGRLYQHILYIDDPTLAIAGVPQRIVPFPVSEAQVGWVARAWSDRLKFPSKDEMEQWEGAILEEKKGQEKSIHNMGFPKDVDYINYLFEQSARAERRSGLENGGQGKIPPYWDEEKRWLRERFPMIKIASRQLGERRKEFTTVEQIGFDYKKWKAEGGVQE